MSDLFKKIELIQNFGKAIQTGIDRTIEVLPIIARQQINTKAKLKFHSTLNEYMDAVQTSMDGYVFIIELDKESWLANALESGKSAFDIKKGILNSPKAKTNAQGKKYMRVPMKKDAKRGADTMGTEKGQEYQRLIEHVMRKPKFSGSTLKHGPDGTVIESQKLITDEPKLQGFYRFRKLESAKNFFSGKNKGVPFQHVMFRTVSENSAPGSWEHPGFKAANIFKDIERDLPRIFEALLDKNIEQELQSLL